MEGEPRFIPDLNYSPDHQASPKRDDDDDQEAWSHKNKRKSDISERPKIEKASHMFATSISIGSWEMQCTMKIYFRRKKLIWEFLDELRTRKKMEVNWSDITALKATTHPGQPGVLQIELKKPPLFFVENNPLYTFKHPPEWEPTSDFTQHQASFHRINRTTFQAGVLDEHLKKLLESDNILMDLSHKPFPSPNSSPYFNSGSGGNGCSKQTSLAYFSSRGGGGGGGSGSGSGSGGL